MNIKVLFSVMALSVLSAQAIAQSNQALVADSPKLQAERWLQLQREGTQKSKFTQTATPAERELAMQRLLESYKHPIPEYYGEEDGGKFKR